MSNPKLQKGDIIIVNEDFIISGTGMTFYFFKGHKYKIVKYLPLWAWVANKVDNAWEIRLIDKIKGNGTLVFSFSEDNLFQKFECIKYTRLKKLKKLSKITE